jgi:signal peptidase II
MPARHSRAGMSVLTTPLPKKTAHRVALLTAGFVVLLDQLSKNWARDHFAGGYTDVIGSWLRVTYTRNPGAAFTSFTGSGQLIGMIGVAVVAFLLYVLSRSSRRVDVTALGLILGGALGNLADRVFRGAGFFDGAVVDWIDWWFIPTFNVADAALNIGVALLLLAMIFAGMAHD